VDGNNVIKDKIVEDNYKVFALLSNYLNNAPDFIDKAEMDELVTYGASCYIKE
jgi:hypothetical protein